MDASAIEVVSSFKHCSLSEQPVMIPETPPKENFEKKKPMCYEDSSKEEFAEFPLAVTPYLLLDLLTNHGLDAQTLARVEATCSYFRRAAQLYPNGDLSLLEIAAFDMCSKKAIFKQMTHKEGENLKKICGGSWKFVLRFISAGEACNRRGKALAISGPGHSIVVAKNGDVYSFGRNSSGELGIGTIQDQAHPCRIRSLQGIHIIQASVASRRTILISDAGRVYSFGKQTPGELDPANQVNNVLTPQLVNSLKDVFVVQAAFGHFFTFFLSREGRVYTLARGKSSRLGHEADLYDSKPRPLLGGLENLPVVQIAAGHCYLLALACHPSGMSVYSVGCGLGGKLGHGTLLHEPQPRLIEEFQTLKFQPTMIAAGAFHCAVVGADGRVCTWGRGTYGCLGHGDEECQLSPKIVSALADIKAVYVAAGYYTTFVVSEDGDLYSFGYGESYCLGHDNPEGEPEEDTDALIPELVTSLKEQNERIVHVSVTDSAYSEAHTLVITESGKLYAFGNGENGQLGFEVVPYSGVCSPELVNIDLS
ncbi:hypothetical protein QQ045_018233 [Rhodiola kirilowii]